MLPFIGLLVPIAFQVQGLYRLRRGRSRVDDFFAVFVGSILAGRPRPRRHALLPDLLRVRRDEGPRACTKCRSRVWRCSSSFNVAFCVRVARARARGARAPLAGRHRPQARADCRAPAISDAWSPTRCSSTASSGSRSSASSTTAPSGDHIGYRGLPLLGTLAEADEIIRQENDRSRLRRASARRARQDARRCRGDQPRRRRRPRRPRPAAVHRAARAAREPRRRSDHQPERRAAARLQQRAEARHRRRDLGGGAARPRDPVRCIIAALIQLHVEGAGVLQAGAHGARRQGVRRLQVPLDVPGRRGRDRPDLGARRRPALHAGRPLAAPLRPRRAAAALERAPRRHVDRRPAARASRTSSSSSSTASRSTCCATRSRPASPAGPRSTAGAATRRSRSASSTTSTTSRTGRSALDIKIMWLTVLRGLQKHAY